VKALILFVFRLYVGWIWVRTGLEKVPDPEWMKTGEAVREYWTAATKITPGPRQRIKYGWYRALLQELTKRELHPQFAKAVVAGHFVSGIALIAGVGVRPGSVIGISQNMAFLLAGSTGNNPPMLLAQTILAMSDPADAERIGIGLLAQR
jgi:thiosulfate dehydrogenase [quinone] large subunit